MTVLGKLAVKNRCSEIDDIVKELVKIKDTIANFQGVDSQYYQACIENVIIDYKKLKNKLSALLVASSKE